MPLHPLPTRHPRPGDRGRLRRALLAAGVLAAAWPVQAQELAQGQTEGRAPGWAAGLASPASSGSSGTMEASEPAPSQEPSPASPSGILLPESAKDKPKEGKILAVGDGKILDDGSTAKMHVKVGDRVLFTSYGGTEVKYNGEEYLIMEERDILGVIEG